LGNGVDLSEYPGGPPPRSALNLVDFLTYWRKDGDLAGRPNVNPKSTPIRPKKFGDHPTLTPRYFDLLDCRSVHE
jgi:hypothetical protein